MGFSMLMGYSTMWGQAGTPVTADEAQAAAALVTKLYTVNSMAKADAKGKPLPKTGSWGVRSAVADERVAGCEADGATCDEVVYRAGQPEIVCSWTVLFPGGGAPPRIVSDNDGSAAYMLRVFKSDDKDRPAETKHLPPEEPPIAKIAHTNGRVVLNLNVDSSGKIVGITIVGSTNPMFNNAASTAAQKWTMTPYSLNGRPRPYQQEAVLDFSSDM